MSFRSLIFSLAVLFSAVVALAADSGGDSPFPSRKLSIQPEPETVYAPPEPATPQDGTNTGGVHLDLTVRYVTDYVYRGVNYSKVSGGGKASNLQFDGTLSFDLGKFPHPFVGLFSNVYDADPVSRFQEIRPIFGIDWNLRPFLIRLGHNTYIYPDREKNLNTSEAFGRLTIDDSYFFLTDRPILAPYVMGAWDYDRNRGWYVEAGVQHDFVFSDVGLTINLHAAVAAIFNIQSQFVFTNVRDNGFQHYELGMTATYSLNQLLHLSGRFGEFDLQGYLNYTDGLTDNINADTKLYGGMGIGFKY